MIRDLLILCLLCLCLPVSFAKAQGNVGIVAVVDDAMISTTDVQLRMKLMALSAGKKLTPDTEKMLQPQALKSLIDEHLYLQQATRLKLKVTEEEIARAIQSIEAKNNLPAGQVDTLLANDGIPKAALDEQLRAQILWTKIIAKEIQPKIRVSDAEVREAKEHISHSPGRSELLISEIVLPIAKGDDKKSAALAQRLVEDLRKGKPFETLAAQYSQTASKENGGKVGWIKEESIPPHALAQIAGLKEGEITDPITTETAYYIIKLHQRRDALPASLYETEVTLKQAFLPLTRDASTQAVAKAETTLETLSKDIRNCQDFDTLAPKAVPGTPTSPVTLTIKDLNPDLQSAVATLKPGDPSPVVRSATGMHLITLCERHEAKAGAEEPAAIAPQDEVRIREILVQQKMELQAKHYLRDLHRRATIEVR